MQLDNVVIKRILSGKTSEFRVLIDRYQTRTYILAHQILGRREDAEDAVQDAFIRAYNGLHTYLDTTDAMFWPWMRKIAINCCIRRFSREIPHTDVEQMLEDGQPCVDDVAMEVYLKIEMAKVREIIAGLPEIYRIIMILKYKEDLSTGEIAELLGVSQTVVRVRSYRALKMLTERMTVTQYEML